MSAAPIRVDRFRVRCHQPEAEALGSALDARRRLARVARTHLPAPLERALTPGGQERWVVEKVEVRLELGHASVREHDDVTLAARWAALIGEAVRSAVRDGRTRFRRFTSADGYARGILHSVLSGPEEEWLARAAIGPRSRPTPLGVIEHLTEEIGSHPLRAVLKADRALARRLFASLSRVERALAVTAMNSGSVGERSEPAPSGLQGPPERSAESGREPAVPATPPEGDQGDQTPPTTASSGRGSASGDSSMWTSYAFEAWYRAMTTPGASPFIASPPSPASGAVAGPGQRAEPATGTPLRAPGPGDTQPQAPPSRESDTGPGREDPAEGREEESRDERRRDGAAKDNGLRWFTLASGLVFLHPWLRHFLEEGVAELGSLEPGRVGVRRCLLLASLLGEPGALASDPLIRFLAGDDPAQPWIPPKERESALPLALDRAEGVLDLFAAAFPGTRSQLSHSMIRDHILHRTGTVHPLRTHNTDTEMAPLVVRPDPGPLDALVHALPYPVTLFKLPWTPPIQVLFGGRHA